MEGDKAFSFLKGLFLGAVAGVAAGILLAPESGEETRKKLKKMANEIGDRAVDMYTDAKKIVKHKIVLLKRAGKKIDESKYAELVSEVVNEFKKDATVTSDTAKKLSEQLKADWTIVKEEMGK